MVRGLTMDTIKQFWHVAPHYRLPKSFKNRLAFLYTQCEHNGQLSMFYKLNTVLIDLIPEDVTYLALLGFYIEEEIDKHQCKLLTVELSSGNNSHFLTPPLKEHMVNHYEYT